jgi:hypothetical protein
MLGRPCVGANSFAFRSLMTLLRRVKARREILCVAAWCDIQESRRATCATGWVGDQDHPRDPDCSGLIGGALGLVSQGAQLTTVLTRLWARRPGSRRRKLAEALTLVEPGDTLTHIERTVGKSARGGFRSGDELSQTIDLSDCRLSVTTDSDGLAQRIRVEVTRGASLPPVTLTPNAGSPLIVALGRSRFAALDSRPCAIWWSLSASAADYRELHYLGRPGDYRHFIFIAEMATSGDFNLAIDIVSPMPV